MASSDGCDDIVWVLGPAEGTGAVVIFGEIMVDGCLKRDKGMKMPRLSRCLVSLAKKPSTAEAVNNPVERVAFVAKPGWGRRQADLPSRAEAIRFLVEAELKTGAKSHNPSRND